MKIRKLLLLLTLNTLSLGSIFCCFTKGNLFIQSRPNFLLFFKFKFPFTMFISKECSVQYWVFWCFYKHDIRRIEIRWMNETQNEKTFVFKCLWSTQSCVKLQSKHIHCDVCCTICMRVWFVWCDDQFSIETSQFWCTMLDVLMLFITININDIISGHRFRTHTQQQIHFKVRPLDLEMRTPIFYILCKKKMKKKVLVFGGAPKHNSMFRTIYVLVDRLKIFTSWIFTSSFGKYNGWLHIFNRCYVYDGGKKCLHYSQTSLKLIENAD